jgi:hypothetical protein
MRMRALALTGDSPFGEIERHRASKKLAFVVLQPLKAEARHNPYKLQEGTPASARMQTNPCDQAKACSMAHHRQDAVKYPRHTPPSLRLERAMKRRHGEWGCPLFGDDQLRRFSATNFVSGHRRAQWVVLSLNHLR